ETVRSAGCVAPPRSTDPAHPGLHGRRARPHRLRKPALRAGGTGAAHAAGRRRHQRPPSGRTGPARPGRGRGVKTRTAGGDSARSVTGERHRGRPGKHIAGIIEAEYAQVRIMRLSTEHAASIRRLIAREAGPGARVRVFGHAWMTRAWAEIWICWSNWMRRCSGPPGWPRDWGHKFHAYSVAAVWM